MQQNSLSGKKERKRKDREQRALVPNVGRPEVSEEADVQRLARARSSRATRDEQAPRKLELLVPSAVGRRLFVIGALAVLAVDPLNRP